MNCIDFVGLTLFSVAY